VQWISQHSPDIVVTGHIHQSPFVRDGSWADRIGSTWVFNTGHSPKGPQKFAAILSARGQEGGFWLFCGNLNRRRLPHRQSACLPRRGEAGGSRDAGPIKHRYLVTSVVADRLRCPLCSRQVRCDQSGLGTVLQFQSPQDCGYVDFDRVRRCPEGNGDVLVSLSLTD
jgi:hypothetical protein